MHEHGKGFAVVADEVRNLAQRASVAAKDTQSLIENSTIRTKEGAEIARILRKLAHYAEQDLDLPTPRDINGNTVGTVEDSEDA